MSLRHSSTTEIISVLPTLHEDELTPLERSALAWLEQERQRLQERIGEQDSQLAAEGFVSGNDTGDWAATNYAQSKQLAMRHLWTAMLVKVESAIQRVYLGRYGQCECCGHAIPVERLKVLPSATLCVPCSKLQAHNVHAV